MDEKEEILEEVQNLENTEIEVCEEIEEVVEELNSEDYDEELETESEEVQDEDFEEYYQSKKPIGKLITLVAFTAIMLVSSTYAWFSAQKTITLNNLEGKVNVAEGIQISLDANQWYQEINFEDYDTSASGIAEYGTRADGTSLALQYGGTAHNHLPSELLPSSTTATAATYESDGTTIKTAANGIGLTDISFYMGEIKETGTLIDKVTSLHSVVQADETIANSATSGYAGYFAIDMFLRNSSRLGTGEVQGEAKETLQLNTNSMLELVAGGVKETGLQNTARVALALYEPDLTVANSSVSVTATQAEILAATTGSTVKIEDVAIWEPNADQHVDYIVTNNNLLYWDATQEDLYLDTFGTYNATSGVYETKTAVTGRSRYTGTDRIPTYALTKESVSTTTELAAKTTKIANIYKWDGSIVGIEKQVTLQTKKSSDDYSTKDGGVRNLVSITSPKTIIYDQGNEDGVVEFQIYKNQVSRLRLYVWLEGQDVDCINHASHGSGIHLDLGLMKSAVVGSDGDTPAEPETSDITEITLSETTKELTVGTPFTLTATVNSDAEDDVIWISSNSGVATVVGSGANKATATVTPVSGGTVTITAKNATGTVSKSCTVIVEDDSAVAELPSTTDTIPYLPTNFSYDGTTNLSNGLTIKDPAQNEYVWVEVPKSLYNNTAYNTKDATADMKPASKTDYDKIEYCLQKYTATYRNGTPCKDEWYSEEQSGVSSGRYTEMKETMLSSVYENGGFYVGKYETGIADSEPDVIDTTVEARTAETQAIEDYTPVIQANAYPYNFVTCAQAQTLASGMVSGGHTTSLLFGVQWDLVLKYLETKGVSQDLLNSDSTSWGNYANNTTYNITNTKAKNYVSSWADGAYGQKASATGVLLSTGADSSFSKQGIYDIAGNVSEWTLEYTSYSVVPCASRGGDYLSDGGFYPASRRGNNSTTLASRIYGFRVSLY